jgi:hypothetical protein
MHYAARTHSEGIGCARWSATSFLRRACSSALIEAGSSRNSGPHGHGFLDARPLTDFSVRVVDDRGKFHLQNSIKLRNNRTDVKLESPCHRGSPSPWRFP